jgi:hypothetical protein
VIGAYRPYERHHRNQSSITYHWLLIMPADGRPLPPSTASAKFSLTHRVASVLAFPKEYFVGHNWFSRMVCASMFHVGLIVGNSDHETSGLCRHTENGSNTRHEHVPRQAPQLQSQLRSRSD